ncbi:hypothetical protein MUCCIDRAFT_159031 [Mucor lusitanicus CBS 277.49]|uniref:Rad51-like C-terminal domain-containing protein n=1 Tax=Mucor lusitanicus CBS 277.49 TaxID=747725 RepID=A0A168Q885_MUCCL|nr:hypothetical protein MUCCIDRAFT_159031 [Mucor lusitanicus CBS 277.49]
MSLSKVIKLPSLLQKLEESGYETLDEVKRECLSSLTRELELNKEEIKAVGNLGAKDKTKTIKIDESLTMEIESSFTTAVKNFDRLFVYGISPKKITEICGESGTGKTQLCGVNDQWTPSLGNEWGNWCANRLFLYRKRNFRYGYLYKSVEEIQNVESVQFCIKESGLFDPENDEVQVAFKKENTVKPMSSSQQQYDDLLQGDELEILAFENELNKIKEQKEQNGVEGNGVEGSILAKRTAEEASDPEQYIDAYLTERCAKSRKHSTQLGVHSQQSHESNRSTFNVHTPRVSDETPTFMPSSQRFFSIPETTNVNNATTTTIPDENPTTTTTSTTTTSIPVNDNQAEHDQVVEESNPWASDGEEEWDLDFLTNIQDYF